MTYKTDYGKTIDKGYLRKFRLISSCAMIIPPIAIYATGEYGDISGGISHGSGTIKGESADGGDPGDGGGESSNRRHSDSERDECSESRESRESQCDIDMDVDGGGCSEGYSDGCGNFSGYGE
ncbi:unnamed protein product [Rotaria sp. Silwood1]|nr:unnamed protein product [Rotaria sp. Silwood1]CAF1557865.1 unnamed protein product [Rotaria sp. Silwood1]CAF3709825.1 unnamed protein product [Rotaria sp. Silwood1]